MGAGMYLIFLLPVALCQSHNVSEECETDSSISKLFCLFQERIESMQNELYATRAQLQEKEKELQDTKTKLEACDLTTYGPTNKPKEETVDYSTLHQYNYQAVDSVRVEGMARRLRAQGTEIWCTTSTTLEVYSQCLRLLRSVPLEGVGDARAVTPLPSGRLVVAAIQWSRPGGLHVLHPNGSRVQSLHTWGRFMDVVSVQGGIHALRDEYPTGYKSTLYSYSITNGEIQYSGSITLPHQAQRMSVFNDTLYLTDRYTDRLYQYSTSGQLLGRHGQWGEDERGTSQPGLLYAPDLCSNDQQGNVLVVDWYNSRLQVWSPREDKWTVIPLAGDSGVPYDAVVSRDGTSMWVMELKNNRYHIMKYTKQ